MIKSKLIKLMIMPMIFNPLLAKSFIADSAPNSAVSRIPLAEDAFAGSSINVVAHLQNTLITHHNFQFAAYYNQKGQVVLAKRAIDSKQWEQSVTRFSGNVNDAHNTISIAVDGAGFLHLSWNHHGNPLNYCTSLSPGSLNMGEPEKMTGKQETSVTYPSFLKLNNGDLLFFYRDGASGKGNIILNRYDIENGQWVRLHDVLLDGEGERNAYFTSWVDRYNTIHIAWTWRETWDVSTNHDICYVRSSDGGVTWQKSDNSQNTLPITRENADTVVRIPMNSSLMNAPHITTDEAGNPYIGAYWIASGCARPQYKIVWRQKNEWKVSATTDRKTTFTLEGGNTRNPPMSRALVLAITKNKKTGIHLIYREKEFGDRIIDAFCPDLTNDSAQWTVNPLTDNSVGAWEPSFDPEQWKNNRSLQMLVEKVEQQDGNDSRARLIPPQEIAVLTVDFSPARNP